MSDTSRAVGLGVAAAALAVAAAVPAVGFTTAGVAKHSLAAAVQSAMGNVPAQSAFSLATSAGATGAALTAAKIAVAGTLLAKL